MALSRDIVIRLLGDADSAVKAQKAAADAAEVSVGAYRRAEREFERQQKAMEVASAKQRRAMQDVGAAAVGFGATMAAGLGLAVKAAVDWESSWAGLAKTVSGSKQQLAALEDGLRGLTRVLPASHQEIAAVAEAAGQLGVKTESIVDFTRTMVNLGETTNLTADEAATSLAQLMNVMGTAPQDVDRLGASLVALGNDGASTEADIVRMASYITGSAKLIGASESDVLALANAMTSMGINAERGGGVMTRVMQDIYAAVKTGGAQLQGFADVAGMSSAEFARAFEADPIRAVDSFIQGLNRVETSGGNVVKTLGDLGYVGTQDTAVLLQLKGAGDLLTDSLDLGSRAWEQNTALVEEAAKRYDTTAAQMEMARNSLTEAGIEIGEVLLPVLADVASGVADVAQWFADLPDPVQAVLASLGSVAAVGGLVGGAFLLLAPRVMETYKAFQALRETSPGVASGLGAVGKAAGVAVAIMAVTSAIDGMVDSMGPAPATMEETTDALLGMGSSMEQVDGLFKRGGADLWSDDINGLADAADKLANPGLVDRLDDFGASLMFWDDNAGRAERTALVDQIEQIGQSLGLMVASGNAELAAEQFDMLAAEWERGGGTVEDLKNLMPAYGEALQGARNEQGLATEATRLQREQASLVAEDLEATYGSIQGYAAALGLSEDATKDLITQTSELGESLADFINPLGVYTGMLDEKKAAEEEAARKSAEEAGKGADAWEDFVVDTGFSFDEYMRRLEEQVTAQANWQTNMLILAGRVSQGTLDELARMGPEGAPLVADLVNRSDAELDRFDDISALRSKQATDAWGAQLTMAAPVLAEIGRTAGAGVVEELARQLAAGTTTIAQIAADYGISLAGGINPILTGLGKSPINMNQIAGRGYRGAQEFAVGGYTGPGSKYDPAGIVHAGEYVLTKEQTSRLGLDRIERFANRGYAAGGFVSTAAVPKPRSTAPAQYPISTPGDATMEKAYADTVAWLAANLEPPAASGGSSTGLLPIMAAARQYVMDTYGIRNIGGFAKRNIIGTNTLSDHGMGKAIDIMTTNLLLGWQIANDFATGPAHKQFKAENVIWQQSISSNGGRFVGMADRGSPTQNHRDHVHVDTYQMGTPYVPRNGLAYLHEGEAVVPAHINARSREMTRGLAAGAGVRVGDGGRGGGGAVSVNIEGAQLVGTLDLGDGLMGQIDATVASAVTSIVDRGRYNP